MVTLALLGKRFAFFASGFGTKTSNVPNTQTMIDSVNSFLMFR